MEEEKKKKQPDIPPNYVTLQQLKERWIQEQQRKQELFHKQQQQQHDPDDVAAALDQVEQEEEEKEEHRSRQQQQQQQKKREEEGNRVWPPRRNYRRRNLDSGASSGGAHPEITDPGVTVALVGEGSGSECSATEAKSAELVDKGKKKRKKKKKKKKNNNKKEKEKEELGSEARAPPIKNEKENVPARRWRFRKVGKMRMDFRPKMMNNIVAESDQTVGIERKTDVVEEGGDPVTDIEQKFGDLSLEKTKLRLESQITVNNWRSGANRDYNGVPNRGNRENVGYNGGFNRGNRGGYIGFNRGNRGYGGYNAVNGRNRGGQRWLNSSGGHRVWVRKVEAADGGDDSVDRSSGVSLLELE